MLLIAWLRSGDGGQADALSSTPASSGGSIKVEFAAGARMRITGAVDTTPPCRRWQMDACGDPHCAGRSSLGCAGHTDIRRGMNSLGLLVQEAFKRDPHARDLYVFRGRSGKLIKILWHDGLGMSLYAKRLERGRYCGVFG